jgi:hypothetical protein
MYQNGLHYNYFHLFVFVLYIFICSLWCICICLQIISNSREPWNVVHPINITLKVYDYQLLEMPTHILQKHLRSLPKKFCNTFYTSVTNDRKCLQF